MSQQSHSYSGRSPGKAEYLQRGEKKKGISFRNKQNQTHTLLETKTPLGDFCLFLLLFSSFSPMQGPKEQHLLYDKPQQIMQ